MGGYKNPQSAKDILQLLALHDKPGWFFDMDTNFNKALPETYAHVNAGSIYNRHDNGVMCFNKEGKPYLKEMLKCIAGDYYAGNDSKFDAKTGSSQPAASRVSSRWPRIHAKTGIQDIEIESIPTPSKYRPHRYAMFDLKRSDTDYRAFLTDDVTASPYQRIGPQRGASDFDRFSSQEQYLYLPDSENEWREVRKTGRNRSSSIY